MSDDGSGVRGVAGFDPAEEVEEGSGILWYAVIRPGCELELTHFPPLAAAALRGKNTGRWFVHSVARLFCVMAHYNTKTTFIKCLNGTGNVLANLFECGLPAISTLIMT